MSPGTGLCTKSHLSREKKAIIFPWQEKEEGTFELKD